MCLAQRGVVALLANLLEALLVAVEGRPLVVLLLLAALRRTLARLVGAVFEEHENLRRAATIQVRVKPAASVAVKMGGFCVKFYRRDRNSKCLKLIRGISDLLSQ